jgi:hypothetical protein
VIRSSDLRSQDRTTLIDPLKRKEEERDQLRRRCANSEIAERKADVTPARLAVPLAIVRSSINQVNAAVDQQTHPGWR